MRPFTSVLLLLLLATALPALSQSNNLSVSGMVKDSADQSVVVGAYVSVTGAATGAKPVYVTTDKDGKFLVSDLSASSSYTLKISYLGYQEVSRVIRLKNESLRLGTILVQEVASNLKEVQVVGQVTAMEQKGDTTQYNAAAFKTNPDASTEDLIQKMPGITVVNGTVTAHGETVNKVLVDGKPFFGEDATLTLKTIPAEIVDKIEVFDKLTDQAQFTGFDDGNGQKTINIVTKVDKRNGQFGKVYAGYGLDDRYQAGGNVSYFNKDQRITLVGLSNNINMQNFSSQDLLGISSSSSSGRGGRGGGGGSSNFLVGNQSGLTGTNSYGLNYSNKLGPKMELTGSYFFNRTGNTNKQVLQQEYFLDDGLNNQFYNENSTSSSTNMNHRLDFRLEYKINDKNSLIVTPTLSFQNNESGSVTAGTTDLADGTQLNASDILSDGLNKGYNFSNSVLWRHSFEKRGRTFSFNATTSMNDKTGDNELYSKNIYYNNTRTPGDTIDQQNHTNSKGLTLGGNLNYTEPLGENGQLQLNYGLTLSNSNSMKDTYNMAPDGGGYTDLDTLLTNNFDNRYITNRAGLGYRLRMGSWFANVGVDFQNTGLYSQQLAPYQTEVDQTFTNLLPNAMLSYRSKSGTQFRAFYRSSTNQPSITQLQNVVNNSNPLALTAGNPDLKQEYSNRVSMRYSKAGADVPFSFNAMLYVTQTNNAIVNSTFIANEATELPNGLVLEKGSKLTSPVNLDGSWNARSFFAYGKPVAPLKLNVNLTTGFNYTRSPGLVNDVANFSNTYAASQGLVVSSNISENLDFTLSYSANYNVVRNTIQPTLNNNYFTQGITGGVNWIFGKGFVFRTDFNNQSYRGLGEGYNQNFTLWNASIGKKFLKNNAGELKLSVFDILKQNNSISRSITETYIQDLTSTVLTQYAMLTFTYTLRNFGKMPVRENDRRGDFPGMGGPRGEGGRGGGGRF
ncbi:TonB-dependent receptor-like protein [Dyadobacter jejuensis]|uniref:TonB-dependent receptor-like protein n=1 Tax=Dyadobacter jejuensis TaxID=1082580 RepID=A0A316AMT6_9BACT|nr:outer membrane beta-barrel protein [Dyadobacter jejuensis]PWJ58414.1 TonB-dependent receptor-like protein [Dyadobacter jejuensis]